MKKNLLLLAFALLAGQGFAQNLDSLKVAREVDSLIQVSRTLTGKGDFNKAIEVNVAAEKLTLEKLGRKSAEYGNICFNQGRILDFMGDIPQSEKWYLDAKSIQEKTLGKEHPNYAATLNNLAGIELQRSNFEKAELLYLEAKIIREKTIGKIHPDYAKILYGIGWLYYEMGRYKYVEKSVVSLEAIEI